MRPVVLASAVALLATAALFGASACGRGRPGSPADPAAAFEARARQVADAWRAAGPGDAWRTGFVPLDDLTVAPPTGFTDDTKFAFTMGVYTTTAALPADTPPAGSVRFPDGAQLPVDLVSARAAYAEIDKGDPPCGQTPPPAPAPTAVGTGPAGSVGGPAQHTCASLTVTGATLGTTTIRTSRGPASAPAWLFTVAELPQPVARVAVAAASVIPLPRPSLALMDPDRVRGLASVHKLTAAEDRRLSYVIGIGTCDTEPAGIAYETDEVVVVAGTVRPPGGNRDCTAALKLEPVTVTLDRPLGERVVLDAIGGRPLVAGQTGP
jgi:hypothetical protein